MRIWIAFTRVDRGYRMIGSKLIQLFQSLPFSHCALVVDLGPNGEWVFESVYPKSRAIEYSVWVKKYTLVSRIQLPNVEHKDIAMLRALMGKRYSIMQLAVIFGAMFINKLNFAWLNGSRRLICTELCAQFMSEIYSYDFKKSFDLISVRDVYRAALRLEV